MWFATDTFTTPLGFYKVPVESEHVSKLSELLNKANRQRWSTRTIEAEARKRGHTITYSTVAKYLSGKHGEPTHQVLLALSDTLGIDINQLRGAAGMPAAGESFVLPAEAARLNPEQRNAILHVVRVMLNDDTGETGTEMRRQADHDLAAHKGEPHMPTGDDRA